MDHDGYWYQYLAARHNIDLPLGFGCLGLALIFILAGHSVSRSGVVSRAKNPKSFWQDIAVLCGIGIVSLGLYLFGPT